MIIGTVKEIKNILGTLHFPPKVHTMSKYDIQIFKV